MSKNFKKLVASFIYILLFCASPALSLTNEEITEIINKAKSGNSEAQYQLGRMYMDGEGVKQNDQKAIEWFRNSAEQGLAIAQNYVGLMYANGQGVKQNYQEALKWFRKAGEQGNAQAQYNIGFMYENGNGVAKSKAEASKWYRMAANQGNATATAKATERLKALEVQSKSEETLGKVIAGGIALVGFAALIKWLNGKSSNKQPNIKLKEDEEKDEICYNCHGKKVCPVCNGRGKVTIHKNIFGWIDDDPHFAICDACVGTGKCLICEGHGILNWWRK